MYIGKGYPRTHLTMHSACGYFLCYIVSQELCYSPWVPAHARVVARIATEDGGREHPQRLLPLASLSHCLRDVYQSTHDWRTVRDRAWSVCQNCG